MSRLFGLRRFVLLCGLSALGPLPGSAQTSVDDALRQIDSLRPLVEEARVARDEARAVQQRERQGAAARMQVPTSFLRVGPLRVIAPTDQADLARELFEDVWSGTFANVTGSPSLETALFAFEWHVRVRPLDVSVAGMTDPHLMQILLSRVDVPSRAGVEGRIRDQITLALSDDFAESSPLRSWLTARGYTPSANAYRYLAATPSPAAMECMTGRGAACRAGLGLGFEGPAPLDWFSPTELQQMVAAASFGARPQLDRNDPDVGSCLRRAEAGACDRVAQSMLDWSAGAPFPDRLRAHLFWYAIRAGGDGAWERALASGSADPGEVMVRASGVDESALVASWHEALMQQRPNLYAGMATTRWVVLLWILIFAALAMRSTRWRLG